jgi:hypothetical protein
MSGHPLCGVINGENQRYQPAQRVTDVSMSYRVPMDKLEVCADFGEILVIHPHIFKRDPLASASPHDYAPILIHRRLFNVTVFGEMERAAWS